MSGPNSDASSWDARYASQELVWSLEPNQFVVEHLEHLAPSKMIDLAGGEGRNALWFASRGWQAENVEISQVALDKFLKRAEHTGLGDNCFATHGDALSAKFELQADLLVIAYLQLPAASLYEALDNACDQLAPGATVFGVWHAKRNLTEGFGGPPMPEVLPTPEELEIWAKQNLVNHEVFEVERIVEKDGAKQVAIDVILKGQLAKSE
ncbi:MAG TPA: class I SAM-dependent methyltransferase [Aquiluna sp.]